MDYALSAIAVLMLTSLALFYKKISTRQRALFLAHARLDSCINSQTAVASSVEVYMGHLPSIHPVRNMSTLLRRIQALRTLGRHAIDQNTEAYDILQTLVSSLGQSQHRVETEHVSQLLADFEQGHAQQQHARSLYNQAALAYNDCQRSALQDWFARRLGYDMAPPC